MKKFACMETIYVHAYMYIRRYLQYTHMFSEKNNIHTYPHIHTSCVYVYMNIYKCIHM